MGKPVVGEVVVLPFPQTNLQSGKRRPALVVADLSGDDLILSDHEPRALRWLLHSTRRRRLHARASGGGQLHSPQPRRIPFCLPAVG